MKTSYGIKTVQQKCGSLLTPLPVHTSESAMEMPSDPRPPTAGLPLSGSYRPLTHKLSIWNFASKSEKTRN